MVSIQAAQSPMISSSTQCTVEATRWNFMGRALACGELIRRKGVSFVGADDSLQYQCGAKTANELDALTARRPVDCSAREP
jgi:hypothetical protein